MGCHFLLQCMKVKSESEVAQSCLTLSDPMDYSLPGSSVRGIFQARVLECPFSWVLVHKVLLCPPRVYFPVLCKLQHLYGGVNSDLLQEGLCYTQVCCTQSPCPCGSPLMTHTSTGDVQTQFSLSLCGVPGSWCTQVLFEPSEHLWQEWGLILNVNSSLLPSSWGFSFAPGHGVSPHSYSRACCLTGVSLILDVGYLLTASPVK